MQQIDVREGALRQHRVLGLFAVVYCWINGLDGLVFDRLDLERLLGLERFKRRRVQWLEEDLREFFKYQTTFWSGPAWAFASLWLSRKPLEPHLPHGEMRDEDRLAAMPGGSPRLAIFKMWRPLGRRLAKRRFGRRAPFFADALNVDEGLMSSYLSLLSQGLIAPDSMPKPK